MPATATPPRPAYPRPPLHHQHDVLFREPVYADGGPYEQDDEDGE
ncbi:hypothetical protein PV382_23850 [Streptomyces scabiei]|nr:hypothetical protein [Streptomyces scabiei]MDX2658321.1 hypothetical protein [Streptomyces scabiei]MDX2870606.1 hypothetical protein [Streptomyces scabiei]MDX3053001.1 hypothetical protein [Streptomyces scabiei]MDX3175287.1 hypothetical protein [Streptomyces scabiei]